MTVCMYRDIHTLQPYNVGTVLTVSDNTAISRCSVGYKLHINAHMPTVAYYATCPVCKIFVSFNIYFII